MEPHQCIALIKAHKEKGTTNRREQRGKIRHLLLFLAGCLSHKLHRLRGRKGLHAARRETAQPPPRCDGSNWAWMRLPSKTTFITTPDSRSGRETELRARFCTGTGCFLWSHDRKCICLLVQSYFSCFERFTLHKLLLLFSKQNGRNWLLTNA